MKTSLSALFAQRLNLLVAIIALAFVGQATAAITAWNSTRPQASGVNYRAVVAGGSMTYTNDAVWQGGIAPLNVPNNVVSVEERTSVAATITLHGTITVGELYARAANIDIYVNKGVGGGKIIFDNGTNNANFYIHSALTRFTSLRNGFNVDIEIASNLNIYAGCARSEEAAAGYLGGTISGAGRLNLNLAMNDPLATRLFKFGSNGSNTYAGGTLIQHVGQTAYGSGNGVAANVQIAVKSAASFGSGSVTFNATGCSAGTKFTGRGMWIRFDANGAFNPTSAVFITYHTLLAFDLNGTTQTVGSVKIGGNAPIADGIYTNGNPTTPWLFGTGELRVGDLSAAAGVDITNENQTVSYLTPSIELFGTNNEYTVGDITWTNLKNGCNGIVPADVSTGWSFFVELAYGSNTITAIGTNANGTAKSDTAIIVRQAWPLPFVDITNEDATVSYLMSSMTVAGTNDDFAVGTIIWTNQKTGAFGEVPADSSTGWAFPVDLAYGTNTIIATGTNVFGFTGSSTLQIVRQTWPLPYVDITNGTETVSSAVESYVIAGTNSEFAVGTIWWTNTGTGVVGEVPADSVTGWSFAVALYYGSNTITVTGTNIYGITRFDSTLIIRSVPGVAFVDITNANFSVAYTVDNATVAGTNSHYTVGAIMWTNHATGAFGEVPADSATGWEFNVSLAYDTNIVTVVGTNYLGFAVSDSVIIFRTWPGPAFVDITNADATVAYSVDNITVGGTNNGYTVGSITWTNRKTGASGEVPANSTTGWEFNVSLGFDTNVITVFGTNCLGLVSSDSVTNVRARPPAAFVDITNDAISVDSTISSVTIAGTNNDFTVGNLFWTNLNSHAYGSVAAGTFDTFDWVIPDAAITYGNNLIVVYGTNYAGFAANDTITVLRRVISYTWDGGASNTYWNNPVNWVGDSDYPRYSGDIAVFDSYIDSTIFALREPITVGRIDDSVKLYTTFGLAGETMTFQMPTGEAQFNFISSYGGDPRTVYFNANMYLQSDLKYHIFHNRGAGGIFGIISGPGRLRLQAECQAQNTWYMGALEGGSNTYSGGTVLMAPRTGYAAGMVYARKNLAFGSGDVAIEAGAKLLLENRTTSDDMIADTASLYLTNSGSTYSSITLSPGVNESVFSLYFGIDRQPAGTYGSSANIGGVKHTNDLYFSGSGILTVTSGFDPQPTDVDSFSIGRGANYGQMALSWYTNTVRVLACTNRYYSSDPANWFVLQAAALYSPWTHTAASNFPSIYYRIVSGPYTSAYDVGKFDVDIAAGSISWLSFPFALQPGCTLLSEWFGQQLQARNYTSYSYPILQVQNGIGGSIVSRSYYIDTFGESTTNWWPSDDPIVQNAGYVLFLAPDQPAVKLTSLGMVPTNDVTLDVPYQTIPWVGLSYPSSVGMLASGITNLFEPPQKFSLFNYDFVNSQQTLGGAVWFAEYFIDDWGLGTTNFFVDITGADKINGGKGYLLFFSTTRSLTGTWNYVKPY